MRSYPIELRVAIVEALGDGLSASEAARRFGVSVSSVKRFRARYQRTGELAPRPHPGRPARERREILDAIGYVVRTGCARRSLPHDIPPWQTVYHYFRAWRLDGTWERIHDALREQARQRAGRAAQPSAGIVDSQSVKTTEKGGSAATTAPRRSTDASGICSST